ncbi:MAG: molybdenum cofactor guanylyltransferase [Bacteroidota bacterium]|nr:molybdenum cofactor guanylyltransferase [Bacteroidota bacterium]
MNNGWTGVVLAGGKSSRMGKDKALIEINGRTLLDHALDKLQARVSDLLVIGDPQKYGHVGPFVIADEAPDQGPLIGLITAMRYASNDRLLVLACDMPNVTDRLLERLQRELGNFTDAVVPKHRDRIEPLCAAYHRRCERHFREMWRNGDLKVQNALRGLRIHELELEPGSDGWPIDLFSNVNRPEDL